MWRRHGGSSWGSLGGAESPQHDLLNAGTPQLYISPMIHGHKKIAQSRTRQPTLISLVESISGCHHTLVWKRAVWCEFWLVSGYKCLYQHVYDSNYNLADPTMSFSNLRVFSMPLCSSDILLAPTNAMFVWSSFFRS